jgi:UDP-N-acetylglucosamine acyltransferase
MLIHRTAIVHPEAELGVDVQVGAYSVIGPGVAIGAGTIIDSHVVVDRNTRIGANCRVHSHAVVGGDPQDKSFKPGHLAFLEIGDRNVIREFVTISRGCHSGDKTTRVGSDCLLMAGVHIAHDCQVGNFVTMANLATLAGHVTVEDRVTMGGLSAVHQFVRIGKLCMVGGTAGIMADVAPFCMVQGAPPATVRGLNLVGLQRNGVDSDTQRALKQCFRLFLRRGMTRENAVAEIKASVKLHPEVEHFLNFISVASKRGYAKAEGDAPPPLQVMGASAGASAGLEPGAEHPASANPMLGSAAEGLRLSGS